MFDDIIPKIKIVFKMYENSNCNFLNILIEKHNNCFSL